MRIETKGHKKLPHCERLGRDKLTISDYSFFAQLRSSRLN